MSALPIQFPPHRHGASDDMWNEYAEAMAAHLNLQLDFYMAVTNEDGSREAELSQMLNVAEARRLAARDVIRRSEMTEPADREPDA